MRIIGFKRCSKCGKDIALRYYNHDYSNIDGYRSSCKLCDREAQKKSRAKMSYITKQVKTCSQCGKAKSITEFGIDKTKKDFHRSYCLDCMRLQARLRNRMRLLKCPKSKL